MGQTLTNGIYLPNEGERNCYSGLAANWNAVDTLKGNYSLHAINVDIHVTAAEKETWNGKADASALTAHTGDTTIHVTSADKQAWNSHVADSVKHVTAEDKQAWNGKADASALTAHTGDTTIHVTAADKQAWNGKADNSALTAHTGDTTIHVTAEDKAKWDAVTSKADDSDVVHKSGDETVGGQKTFSHVRTGVGRDLYHFTASPYGKNTPPANISYQYVWFIGNSASQGFANNWYGGYLEQVMYTDGSARGRWLIRDTSESNLGIELFVNGNDKQFRPQGNNTIDLGTPTNKWKSFNGLEPSSLSLPGYSSSRIDISSYITDLTGGNNNYIAPSNGYIFVRTTNGTYLKLVEYPSGVVSSVCSQTADDIGTFIPVLAGRTCIIQIKCSSIDRAYFIPCQGNV